MPVTDTYPETDQLDPELLPPTLDLSRPELEPIMDRYRAPLEQPVPAYRPLALLVGREEAELEPLASDLEAEGWVVGTCPGPESTRCPLITGGSCVLRDDADVTVMFADPGTLSAGLPSLPRLVCAAYGDMPSVIALEGRIDPPRVDGRHTIVGAAWGSRQIIEAMELTKELP
jgi:hypothetical protein